MEVKKGYPSELTSKEILTEIENLRRYGNGGAWRADIIAAANSIIQSGQAELTDRFLRRTYWVNFWLTVLSVATASAALYFSAKTDRDDAIWRDSEIYLLRKIQGNLQEVEESVTSH